MKIPGLPRAWPRRRPLGPSRPYYAAPGVGVSARRDPDPVAPPPRHTLPYRLEYLGFVAISAVFVALSDVYQFLGGQLGTFALLGLLALIWIGMINAARIHRPFGHLFLACLLTSLVYSFVVWAFWGEYLARHHTTQAFGSEKFAGFPSIVPLLIVMVPWGLIWGAVLGLVGWAMRAMGAEDFRAPGE